MSLLGVKRTWRFALHMSAFDPKRTLAAPRAERRHEPIRSCGPRGAHAHAADPDDLARLHLWRFALDRGGWRGRRDAPVVGNDGVRWDDRRHALWTALYTGVLCGCASADAAREAADSSAAIKEQYSKRLLDHSQDELASR